MQRDLDTLLLVLDWLSVEVPLAVIVDGAGPELRAAVVHGLVVWANGEAVSWGGTLVTLPLGGWWSQDAATALLVVEAAILQAVGCWRIATAHTVLAVLRQLA